MSLRADTSQLVAPGLLASLYPGHGIRGDAVPTGGAHGTSPIYAGLTLPADAALECRITQVTALTAGWTVTAYEDTSLVIVPPLGTVDATGQYSYVPVIDGVAGPAVVDTVIIGAGSGPALTPASTTAPGVVMPAAISYTAPGGVALAPASTTGPGVVMPAAIVYAPPVVDDWRPTARPAGRRLSTATRGPRVSSRIR